MDKKYNINDLMITFLISLLINLICISILKYILGLLDAISFTEMLVISSLGSIFSLLTIILFSKKENINENKN